MSQSEYWTEFMRQRLSRRRLLGLGATAGVGLWVGSSLGCSGGSTAKPSSDQGTPSSGQGTPTPKYGGVMRVNVASSEPIGLDPFISRNIDVDLAYEKLLYYNQSRDKFVPRLAEKWEIPDENTYVFSLKKGVKFHNLPPVNGREFVADDVLFNVERLLTDATNFTTRSFFTPINKTEAVDKYTVKMTTTTPFAPLLGNFAYSSRGIMPREIIGDKNEATIQLGTGPFLFDRWQRTEMFAWKKNPDYHIAGLPYLDRVEYRWAPDYTARVALYISDQADIVTMYGQDSQTIMDKRPATQMQQVPSLYWWNIIFRTGFKPTDDVRVRRAMDLMAPRWEIAYRVFGNVGKLYGGKPVGPMSSQVEKWALPLSELEEKYISYKEKYPKEQALAEAKKLMAEAGYADGFEASLQVTSETYSTLITQMVQDWWREIGIKINIKSIESTAHTSNSLKGEFELSISTAGGDPDPDRMLYNVLHTGVPYNYGRWSDPVLDKMLDEQRVTLDETKRKAIVLDIQRHIMETVPRLYVYDWSTFTAVRENIRDFHVNYSAGFSGWEWFGGTWFEK